MDKAQTVALSLKAAYIFGAEHGLQHEVDEIKNMEIEWEFSYDASVKREYIVGLFERHNIFEEFKARHWTYGSTPGGESRRRFYLKLKQRFDDFLAGRGSGEVFDGDSDEEEADQQFAAEYPCS